jgi:hypothetical protein
MRAGCLKGYEVHALLCADTSQVPQQAGTPSAATLSSAHASSFLNALTDGAAPPVLLCVLAAGYVSDLVLSADSVRGLLPRGVHVVGFCDEEGIRFR